jgi:prepilin-type N-terminal cleavage/methylation domain-containing protein
MNYIRAYRGFSLIELLLAIFILGIGVISIATLFPAGIAQQQKTVHDILGPIIARNAMTILRSRLEQEDFGGVEEFDSRWQFKTLNDGSTLSICNASSGGTVINPWPTICGDWMWFRPAIVPNDYGDPENPACIAVRGALDIFGTAEIDIVTDEGPANVELWPNTSVDDYQTGFVPPGIPYNKERYPDIDSNNDGNPDNLYWPVIRVFAGERQYPMWTGNPAQRPEAKYYWDCMFRRYEGRILVAIFVYRVVDPSQTGSYLVDTAGLVTPDFPRRVNLATETSTGSWDATLGSEVISGSELDDPTLDVNQWHYPGQWIVDQNGNVHNVQRGRRRPNDGPVRLAARPVELSGFYSIDNGFPNLGVNVHWWEETGIQPPAGADGLPIGIILQDVVTDIWFVPTKDSIGRRLIPVYATVQEL